MFFPHVASEFPFNYSEWRNNDNLEELEDAISLSCYSQLNILMIEC